MQKINSIKELGLLIRKTRKAQGLSQEQLSATCGVGVRFIREVEQGKETCQMGKVLQVLQMLGFDIFTLKRGNVS